MTLTIQALCQIYLQSALYAKICKKLVLEIPLGFSQLNLRLETIWSQNELKIKSLSGPFDIDCFQMAITISAFSASLEI